MLLPITAPAVASTAESVAESVAETLSEASGSLAIIDMTPEEFIFDYASRVPVLSIVFMGISLFLMILVPIFVLFRTKNRFRFDMMALFYGLLAYMLGLGVLPSVLEILLGLIPSVRTMVTESVVIGGTLHSIFLAVLSFASISLCLRLTMKKSPNVLGAAVYLGTAITIMPILTQGITYLMSYLSAAISINQGQLADSVAAMIAEGNTAADIQQGLDSMTDFIQTPALDFLYIGIDLTFQLAYFLGLTILLACCIGRKAPKSTLYKAFGLQAVFCVFYTLRCCGLLENILLCAAFYLVLSGASLFLAYRETSLCIPDELAKFMGKPDASLSIRRNKNDDKPHKMPKIVMPKD